MSQVGTPYWMAPEIVEQTGPSTPACDIWSLGCTIIELLTGNPPYYDLNAVTALFRIVSDPMPPLPHTLSPLVKDFLSKCFQKEPLLRITAPQLLKHPWLVAQSKVSDLEESKFPEEVANTVKNHMDSISSSQGNSIEERPYLEQIEEEDDSDFLTMLPIKIETSPVGCYQEAKSPAVHRRTAARVGAHAKQEQEEETAE